jgi:Kef-type K+ transport system membrane component KefB
LTSQDFVAFALQISVMLGFALIFGQLMRRIKQPAVLGEMIGGIVLGPTVFGALAPALFGLLFLSSANVAIARDAFIKLGMLFFLFVVGLETNIWDLGRLRRNVLMVGLAGTLLPIAAGIALVYALPREFWGPAVQPHFFAFALFIGMNLANSANPVLGRILMDLGLLNGDIGKLCMTATVFDDLINWTLFAVILAEVAPSGAVNGASLPVSVALALLAFVVILGVGRRVGPTALEWIRGHLAWPSGYIATTGIVILVAASLTERLGIHAFLGAFLVGAALSGQGAQFREAHDVILRFALAFFAPVYFVSMGMTTNFIANFDGWLVLVILAAALTSKLGGVLVGARAAGMPLDRETWAVAFGLNARGATGIILAGVGLAAGLIDDRIFVAIAVMALATSLLAGPAMNWLLAGRIAAAQAAGAGSREDGSEA